MLPLLAIGWNTCNSRIPAHTQFTTCHNHLLLSALPVSSQDLSLYCMFCCQVTFYHYWLIRIISINLIRHGIRQLQVLHRCEVDLNLLKQQHKHTESKVWVNWHGEFKRTGQPRNSTFPLNCTSVIMYTLVPGTTRGQCQNKNKSLWPLEPKTCKQC